VERITPRYVFEARIRIRVQRASQNLAMEGWARDISETGISAFVAQGLIIGEIVTLEIPLASSRWQSIPAKVARCIGTQYGFQFTALSPDQRENIRLDVRDHPEIGAYGRPADTKIRVHRGEAEPRVSARQQETQRDADTAFADRARILIKRGYTPKVAVELVLHEMEFEQGSNSKRMEKARADAENFLTRARQGLI
jgi:PilZ domain-containing protein